MAEKATEDVSRRDAKAQRKRQEEMRAVSYRLSAGGWRDVVGGAGIADLYGFDADAWTRPAHRWDGMIDEADDVFALRRDC
jgi:hypothetical protein